MADNQGTAAPQPAQAPQAQSGQTQESAPSQGSTDQLAAQVDANPNLTPQQKEVAKKHINKIKLKVDGREIEEDLPFDIEDDPEIMEYLTKHLQMSKVSQKRMGEYSQLEKEVQQFIAELRKNPKKALSNPAFGVDLKKLAADVIEEEIQNSQKSPEQLKREELENKLRDIEEERKQEKDANQKREFERLQQQEFERYDSLMSSALDKSDLPKSPYVVKKVADYMLMGLQQGLDVTPEDVLPLVREEMQNDLKEMFAVMPEEVIEKIIGKDVLKKIRKKNVEKARNGQPPVPVKSALKDVGTKPAPGKPSERQTFKKFFGV